MSSYESQWGILFQIFKIETAGEGKQKSTNLQKYITVLSPFEEKNAKTYV